MDCRYPDHKDVNRLDATTEQDIAVKQHMDEAVAMLDAAKFARRVRKRLGLSQAEFSHQIDELLHTIRNWEQGKRRPTGAAKTLLKIHDEALEGALAALKWCVSLVVWQLLNVA